jgi:NAD(P)-dependent dehydrogenase (short-subunit alcohol dehydrogenase family)
MTTVRYVQALEIEGKRVLLSGATGGLGRAIAEQLAANGAKLVLSSRKKAELEDLRRSLPRGDERHEVIVADLAEQGAPEKLVRTAGDVDVVVANAALPGTGRLESFSEEEVRRALRVNLEAPILIARELTPSLTEKGEGHMVFIASLAGKVASPPWFHPTSSARQGCFTRRGRGPRLGWGRLRRGRSRRRWSARSSETARRSRSPLATRASWSRSATGIPSWRAESSDAAGRRRSPSGSTSGTAISVSRRRPGNRLKT